ncbi:alpha/beta hydrolase family protein [Pseudosporangium ferrugineum]|uniref:Alpha/beta hydrolase family protein n=1 Tax=Pseudosporangium ferrugineum TaxID=439699 RepID=A0A2T0RIS5_9ACTN|nr:alpha/beta hydrolase family protein [Pseudosporangium ferrugineum]
MPRRVVAAVALAVAGGVLATVSVGFGAEADAGQRPVADPLRGFRQQVVKWGACPEDAGAVEGLRCASVVVPLDYRRPYGDRIRIAVSRLPGVGRGPHRPLFLNPGGPGGSALDMPASFRAEAPAAVLRQYDLIGMDPRGLGHGTALDCKLSDEREVFVDQWSYPYRRETFGKVADTSRRIAEACARAVGPEMAHFTTANTARDMDLVRGLLGAPKLSYFGVSYGTYLGAVYTQLFPQRADRIVLDSAVDPTRSWRGVSLLQAEAAGPAFDRWVAWAARHDSVYHLGRTPEQVRRTFGELLRRPGEPEPGEEIQGSYGDQLRAYMTRDAVHVKDTSEYVAAQKFGTDPVGDPDVVDNPNPVDEDGPADGTEPEGRPQPTGPASVLPSSEDPDANFYALNMVIQCGEGRDWPTGAARYRREAAAARARGSLGGDLKANVKPCAYWKIRSAEPPVTVRNTVPALIVQNQWDANTPLAGARAAHRALAGSRMVTVRNGEGHGIYLEQGNRCARDRVSAYLTTGRLPAADLTCVAPEPKP